MDAKYEALSEAIMDGDEEMTIEEAHKLIDAGADPAAIFSDCVQESLNILGEQFSNLEIFLPELMMAGEAVSELQTDLMPLMKKDMSENKIGTIVLGTAFGDVHDIGKNMVGLMLEVNNFNVIDLGTNIAPADFVRAAKEHKADIVVIPALMLPSMPYMEDTIRLLKADSETAGRVRIMVGGGPINQKWADKVGADGYSEDAAEAVTLAKSLLR